jgi:accessory gene regulator protein AgrB
MMQDVLSTFLLICAAIASLCFGVLLAYGFCKMAFVLLRMHAQSIHAQSVAPRPARVEAEAVRAL